MKYTFSIVLIVVVLTGAACSKDTSTVTTNETTQVGKAMGGQGANRNSTTTDTSTDVSWSFNGSSWQSSDTPPACPDPLTISTPVDLATTTAILYPGQTRGGNYKPHGGFIFGSALNNSKTVTAPMDAIIDNGSRYIEQGETQYLFTFINPCGVAYRFDHLLTLSPALQAVADTLPAAQVDNSVTTRIEGKSVRAGDTIATEIGFRKTKNVSVDFGAYDLRKTNGATKGGAEYGQHALCWLNNLSAADKTKAKSLPGGDQSAGKTSDYCK